MKSRRMWSLLTAAALSGGVITFANVTPPVVAAAETMADQYQPYYDDSAIRAVPHVSLFPQSESELPYGTTFSLFDHVSYDQTVFVDNAVMVSLSPDSGKLLVWFNDGRTPNLGITTTSFRMAAHYPDGSSEIFRVTLNLIPEDTHAYDAAYDDAYIRIGSRAEIVPFIRNHYGTPFPDGTSFSLTGYYEVDDRRAEGWIIELNRVSGVLTIEIPESAAESSVEVPIVVTYPDGSKDNISTTVFAEGPDDAELYTPSFEMVTVQAGTTGTTDSLAAGLPSDTGFYLSDLGPLSSFFDAGGSISISWDGSFTIDVPATWTEDFAIPLFVLFPDGSSTTSDLEIDVIPADQNTIFDVQFEHYHLQAGTTGTIYGATDAALPPGTSIEMVEDENIDALRAAGWEFNVIDDLNISVAVPADATDGVNVNVNVTYPDGTSEIAPVDVLVNPLFAALYDVEYSEVVLNAGDSIYVTPDGAWGGWSSYASVSVDENPELAALRAEGWSIEGNGYTGLYITAPQTATTSTTLPLTIHYYDGSTEESQVRITVIPEKQAVLHEVTYPPAVLLAGGSLTVFPENTDLPDGTLLLLSQDQNLDDARNAGWTIDNYLSGEFFITAPITATEGIQLTFQVVYPDGTFEHTTADISVDPANHAGNHDVTYPATTITAGDTTTITPDTTDLPTGTNITLEDDETLAAARTAGWNIEADASGNLTISSPITATSGIEATFLVSYPDGTFEHTTADISVDPANHAGNHDVTYPATTITAGDTTTITPDTTDLPTGTNITLEDDETLATARTAGWNIEADASGNLTISSPITATSGIEATFLVSYPDGTFEHTTADISVDPANHAGNHDVTYPATTITAGDTTTITPDTTDLPTGTNITLVEDLFLGDARNAGWEIDSDTNGTITVSAPVTSTSGTTVSVLVIYPDGTQKQVFAPIEVIATNHAGNHDVTYPATTIAAGDTTTITPVTSGLPAGTTIALVKDRKFNTAQAAGWTFTIAADGKITASSLESSVGYAVINVLITYPDGTSETVEASISAVAEPVDEQPVDEKPAPSQAVSGSSFGSS